jgi:E3 ubiquitin-protein ligase DOA10
MEEGRIVHHSWDAWLSNASSQEHVSIRHDGQLARVPKHDNVRYIPGRRMVVPVDPVTLEPIDDEERLQGHPSVEDPEHKDVDTTIVYIPPRFKLRMVTFMTVMCISWMALLCYLFVGPVAVGRLVFARFTIEKVHDVYSHCVGSIIMIFFGFSTKHVKEAALSLSNRSIHSFHHTFSHLFKWVREKQ